MGSFSEAEQTARDARWSSSELKAGDPLNAWNRLMAESVAEMDIDSQCGTAFRADWTRYGLGQVDINNFRTSEQSITRNSAMVRRCRDEVYALSYLRHGSAAVRTGGVDIHVPAGSFVLVNHALPYTMRFPDGAVAMTAHMRASWLRRWVPQPETMIAKVFDATRWGGPLAALLTAIDEVGLEDAVLPRSDIADQLGSFLALMNGNARSGESIYKGELLQRARRLMRDRLDDASFTPDALAQGLGISKRYVHKLFAGDGTTFGGDLLDFRLARAAELLRDRRYGNYRVADVAYACGFSDPSHFARRFRQRFGMTPLAYQKES